TFYEIVTGQRPIGGSSEYSIMSAHLTQAPTPPDALNPKIPPNISAIILKALAKNPADRFQSAHEFQSELLFLETTPSAGTARPAMRPTPAIDPARLAGVEAKLLPLLGPVSTRLIARAARQCSTMEELCRSLAEHLPGQREREAFLQSCGAGMEPPPVRNASAPAIPAPAGTGSTRPVDPSTLAAAKQKLAAYIGPIAQVIVDRAARRVHTQSELYEAIAAEIPSARDREVFLASLPR
ncbi:MAG: hypothetical protein ACREH9_01540, partial [Pseudomonadota bacterium]